MMNVLFNPSTYIWNLLLGIGWKKLNILLLLQTGQEILMKLHISKGWETRIYKSCHKKINIYYSIDHCPKSIKHEFVRFLFQDVLSYTDDEVTDLWIKCANLNKKINCKFSETVTIDILPSFIKSIVFHLVGLSCLIETKDQYDFAVDEHFTPWCTGGSWYNINIFQNLHGPIFDFFG